MGALDRLVAWAQRTVDGAIDRRASKDVEIEVVMHTFFAALDERDRIALKAVDHASDAYTRLAKLMRSFQAGQLVTMDEVARTRALAEEALETLVGYRRIVNGHSDRLKQLRRRFGGART